MPHVSAGLVRPVASLGRPREIPLSLLTKIRTLRQIRPAPEPEQPDVARAVAIIMDGNARWARRRGLPIAARSWSLPTSGQSVSTKTSSA